MYKLTIYTNKKKKREKNQYYFVDLTAIAFSTNTLTLNSVKKKKIINLFGLNAYIDYYRFYTFYITLLTDKFSRFKCQCFEVKVFKRFIYCISYGVNF